MYTFRAYFWSFACFLLACRFDPACKQEDHSMRSRAAFSCFSVFLLLPALVAADVVGGSTFREVTPDIGMDLTHTLSPICNPPISSGAAWADFDADGDIDMFATDHGGANRLYRNEGDTTFDGMPDFVDVAPEMGISDPLGVGLSAVWIDYDNDGDQDLYVTNWSGNTLWQNQLSDTGFAGFIDATFFAGVEDYGRTITSAWADFDEDGDLDVYLAKHGECNDVFGNSEDQLYQNNGNGTFTNVTHFLCDVGSCGAIDIGLGFSAVWFDYEGDGDLDIYVVNDNIGHDGTHYENVMWQNDGPDGVGGWIFTDVSTATGTGKDVNGMGLGIGDHNNDGWFDLAFSNIGKNSLLENNADGTFADISLAAGIEREFLPNAPADESITWGTAFFDYDNDMLQDLFFVAGYINNPPFEHPSAFFANNGDGTFTEISGEAGLNDTGRGRSLSMADFDLDGFVDLFVGNYGEQGMVMRNDAGDQGNTNHWIGLTLAGTESNRDAIGSVVTVETPDGTSQVRLISSGPSHGGGDHRIARFGLGANDSAIVSVTWPDGDVQQLGPLDVDEYHHIQEGLFLAEIEPGIAGQENTIRVFGAEPGTRVGLFGNFAEGQTAIDICPGAIVDIDNAQLRGESVAGPSGNVIRVIDIPASLSGRTGLFQIVQQDGCGVSNLVSVEFE